MKEIKPNDIVCFTKNGKDKYGVVLRTSKKNAVVMCYETGEELRVPLDKLSIVPPVLVDARQLKKLCRYELKMSDIMNGHSAYADIVCSEDYVLTFDDLLAAMENIGTSEDDNDTISEEWYLPVCNTFIDDNECIDFEGTPDTVEMIDGLPTRKDSISDIINYMICDLMYESDEPFYTLTDEITDHIKAIVENEKKPILKRSYTDSEKKNFIRLYDNDDRLNKATPKELDVFRAFVDELCIKDSKTALRAKGYGCYGGNPAYECDWKTSLECVTRLYELTGKAVYANTLGYIYYYGRCWNGEPKFDEAFKYFSIGAAGRYYESQYKLADMFEHGYGVAKNTDIAVTILEMIYDENLEYMKDGKFDCKFADIALRLGKYAKNGYLNYHNNLLAYYYYLQADFAIRQRLMYDHYGDTSVAESIKNGLDSIVESDQFGKTKKTAEIHLESFLRPYLKKYRKLQFKLKSLKDGSGRAEIRIVPFDDEKYPPKMFITNIDTGFCGMLETVKIKLKDSSIIAPAETNIDLPLMFDNVDRISDADDKEGVVLLLGDKITGIITGRISFTSPVRASGKKYRFASVYFDLGGKHYDYLLDIDGVSVGDTVIVMTDRGKTEVTVAKIFEKTESEMALPISKYKKIIEIK